MMISLLFFLCLLICNTQSQEVDYYYSDDNTFEVTELGTIQNALNLLVRISEDSTTSPGNYNLNTLASNYYGQATFSILIAKANNNYVFPDTAWVIPSGWKLRLPSVLLCTQFISVDCVYQSYKSSLTASSFNYWNKLPTAVYQTLSSAMTYPKYPYFIMNYLTNTQLNPETNLQIRIVNKLFTDLNFGTLIMLTGFGESPKPIIKSHSEGYLNMKASDLLQGIHGYLTYSHSAILSETSKAIRVAFRVYSGNGTISNSFQVFEKDVETTEYVTQLDGYRDLIIDSDITVRGSITSSPNAQLTLMFLSRNQVPVFTHKPYKIISYNDQVVVDGIYSQNGYYSFATNTSQTGIWQGWYFIPVQTAIEEENFSYRIINSNSSLAIEANRGSANFIYSEPDENNQDQVWMIIPRPGSTGRFLIKSPTTGLCWKVNTNSGIRGGGGTSSEKMMWLNYCEGIGLSFEFSPFLNFAYV